MKSRQITAIINLLEKIQENQKLPPEIDERPIKLARSNNILSLTNVFVAAIGITLIIYQICSNVKIERFNELIGKTDTLMDQSIAQSKTTDSLLHLNIAIAKVNDSANKYRFIAALFDLGSNINTREYVIGVQQHKIAAHPYSYINIIIPIMEGQMNNPYLYKNDTMLRLWINALVHLNMVNPNATFIEDNSGNYITDESGNGLMDETNLDEPLDLISDIKPDKTLVGAYDAMYKAYKFCCKKLKPEVSHFISK